MQVSKTQRVGEVGIEINVNFQEFNDNVADLLAFLDFPIREKIEIEQPKRQEKEPLAVDMIVELINRKGRMSKADIKQHFKGQLSAKKVEETIKEYKDVTFEFAKEHDMWMVCLVEDSDYVEHILQLGLASELF